MSTEQNKKIVLRIFSEGMTERKFQVFEELISENFINHSFPNSQPGPKGFKAIIQQFTSAFPDMKISVQGIIAEGETVATRGSLSGTHKGEFMGIAATGKKVRIEYVDFWKLSSGKCVENWVQMDIAGVLQQLESREHAL